MEKKYKKKVIRIDRIIIVLAILVFLIAVPIIVYIKTVKPGEQIAATVDGEKITIAALDRTTEFIFLIRGYPESYKQYVTKDAILREMIDEAVLLNEAKRQNVTVESKEAEAIINQVMVTNSLTDEDLNITLGEHNFTRQDLNTYYKRGLTINALLSKTFGNNISVAEENISEYYKNNLAEFSVPETVKVQHILIAKKANFTDEQILNMALDIRKMINETNFQELALRYSDDAGSRKQGGGISFSKGEVVPEFENASRSLSQGEVSMPVKTDFGYHLIKLISITGPRIMDYPEARNEIASKLAEIQMQALSRQYLNMLKRDAQIQIFYNSSIEK